MSKRHTFWIYIFIISLLILLVWIFFTSPSSEARVSSHGPGFFESSKLTAVALERPSQGEAATNSVNPACQLFRVTAYCPCDRCCGKWSELRVAEASRNKEFRGFSVGSAPRGNLKKLHFQETETAIYRVTAYCPCKICCEKYSDGVTASGHIIKEYDAFVAASPVFAFGTMLKVPGYNNDKPVPVLDRGGAIKGNRLDIFCHTHQEALNWGVKHLKVEVVK